MLMRENIFEGHTWLIALCRPKFVNFQQTNFGGKMHRFNPQKDTEFGSWLEYNESKDAVFCLYCYLFSC